MHIDKRSPLGVSASIILALCLSNAAQADDGFNTTINGYGTIGGTYTGNSSLTYIQSPTEYKATNSQFDLGVDSRIGVQGTFAYGDKISIVVQEEAKRRGSENFSLGTEWAFFQYKPTDDLKLRLGRVVLAAFLTSDYREVGYAQPWFTAPNELYGLESIENIDGAQALYHIGLGPVGLDLQGAYGSASSDILVNGATDHLTSKSVSNVSAALTYGSFLFRVAETTLPLPSVLPLGPTTLVSYVNRDKFLSVGFQYDNGKALLLSEWAKRSENNIPLLNIPTGASTQWYVAGGWRFGKLTPLLSYATFKTGDSLIYGPTTSSSSTPSFTLRYDVITNVALKAQISSVQGRNSTEWASPSTTSNERVNVFSLGADFVF
jgi:hypothetical protein